MTRPLIFSLLACVVPLTLAAEQVLVFPEGSVRGFEATRAPAPVHLPVGPYSNGQAETTEVEGAVVQQVWKTPNSEANTHGLMASLRDQLETADYEVLFECETRSCGGFDFRFNLDVVAEPEMHVDLGDFRYLSAAKATEGDREFIELLISRSPDRGFIQITKIGSETALEPSVALSTKQPSATTDMKEQDDLAGRLSVSGAVVLEGLNFLKGSSELDGDPSTALQELAALLTQDPSKTVVLVGHTDASGSLKGNVALSRKRADSVMLRLIETYGVDPAQLSAEGVGYLSPRASNATAEGREENRRVEVVLTAVE